MNNQELRSMVREIVREELANYLRTGLDILEDQKPMTAHQVNNEINGEPAVDDAFTLLEQHSDVMASWMRWASNEDDETDWQDFDGIA